MISGHGLDPKGKKMSKSKGNVIEPFSVIEKYSADALRFWAATAKLGSDLPYNEKDVVTGQKTLVKLWNASRFCEKFLSKTKKPELKPMDKWVLSKLMNLIKNSTDSCDKYEYSDARQGVEVFFWHVFCDNYLETVKYRAYNNDESAKWTLYKTLLTVLKLYSPLIPFITEEIYQNLYKKNEKEASIHISSWPEFDKSFVDKEREEIGDVAVAIISSVRQYKSNKGLPLNSPIERLTIECDKKLQRRLKEVFEDIKGTVKINQIEFEKGDFDLEGYEIRLGIKL